MKRLALSWFVVLGLAGLARAESLTIELTVSAGEQDRIHTPVRVPLTLPAAFVEAAEVTLTDAAGKKLPAQLTAPGLLSQGGAFNRELHFVLPDLKKGQSVDLKATIATGAPTPAEGFSWHDTPGQFTELKFGNQRPVLRYMYQALDPAKREETYKPYHHLYDPTGLRIVTKGPGGQYTHHRGLYFGFNKITYGDGKKADVWHCSGDAYQSHEKFLAQEHGPVLGRHRLEIAWHGMGKEVFAIEERELTAYQVPGGQLIEFAARVKPTLPPLKLDGDPQHAGFQFRAHEDVQKNAKQTFYIRPDGVDKPGATKQDGDFPWKGMSFVVGGDRYTAGYLDLPSNPKPAHYSERDYGRFGSYFVYEATPDKPLAVHYRLSLRKGEATPVDLANQSADFVKPPVVKVK